jgi:hypothetical protein
MLPPSVIASLTRLGRGNLSAGIRLAASLATEEAQSELDAPSPEHVQAPAYVPDPTPQADRPPRNVGQAGWYWQKVGVGQAVRDFFTPPWTDEEPDEEKDYEPDPDPVPGWIRAEMARNAARMQVQKIVADYLSRQPPQPRQRPPQPSLIPPPALSRSVKGGLGMGGCQFRHSDS